MNLEAFDQAMFEAVEAAQVGFHFEEGGCWGMARALHDRFAEAGFDPVIKYKPTEWVHCWVECCGVAFDYRGTMLKEPPFGLTLDDMWFAGIAARNGINMETLNSDIALAREIVDQAFAQAPLIPTIEGISVN